MCVWEGGGRWWWGGVGRRACQLLNIFKSLCGEYSSHCVVNMYCTGAVQYRPLPGGLGGEHTAMSSWSVSFYLFLGQDKAVYTCIHTYVVTLHQPALACTDSSWYWKDLA